MLCDANILYYNLTFHVICIVKKNNSCRTLSFTSSLCENRRNKRAHIKISGMRKLQLDLIRRAPSILASRVYPLS